MKQPVFAYIPSIIIGGFVFLTLSSQVGPAEWASSTIVWFASLAVLAAHISARIITATYKRGKAHGKDELLAEHQQNRNEISLSIGKKAFSIKDTDRSGTIHLSPPERAGPPMIQGFVSRERGYVNYPFDAVYPGQGEMVFGYLSRHDVMVRFEASYAEGLDDFFGIVNDYAAAMGNMDGFLESQQARQFCTDHSWPIGKIYEIWNLVQAPVSRQAPIPTMPYISMPEPEVIHQRVRRSRKKKINLSILSHQPRQITLD